MTEFMTFDGPCPFLLCLITKPHEHGICPDCGAVRYGNLGCKACMKMSPIERAMESALAKVEVINA